MLKNKVIESLDHLIATKLVSAQDNQLDLVLEKQKTSILNIIADQTRTKKISLTILDDSIARINYFDFSLNNQETAFEINLLKSNTTAEINISLLANHVKKQLIVHLNSIGNNTKSTINFFALARNHGEVSLTGSSSAIKGSKDSSIIQKASGIVLDSGSKITIAPQLKINHQEIKASHSLSVGQLNDDELFYLCSRGYTKDEASSLIIQGLFSHMIEKVVQKNTIQQIKTELNNAQY